MRNSEKKGVIAVLKDSGFDMALAYMTYCRKSDVDWPQWSSSWTPYDYSMGEVSSVPSGSASSTRRRNALMASP